MFRDRSYEERRLQAQVDELREEYSLLLARLNRVATERDRLLNQVGRKLWWVEITDVEVRFGDGPRGERFFSEDVPIGEGSAADIVLDQMQRYAGDGFVYPEDGNYEVD